MGAVFSALKRDEWIFLFRCLNKTHEGTCSPLTTLHTRLYLWDAYVNWHDHHDKCNMNMRHGVIPLGNTRRFMVRNDGTKTVPDATLGHIISFHPRQSHKVKPTKGSRAILFTAFPEIGKPTFETEPEGTPTELAKFLEIASNPQKPAGFDRMES